jgi:hypothetical protein
VSGASVRSGPADRPIFVVGSVRSGTTLVRFMLCSHPRIFVPPESNFISRYFGRHPTEPMSERRARQVLEGLYRFKPFWRDWGGERPDPRALLASLPERTPAALLNALYADYARRHGAVRWGDKTPGHVQRVELISEMFPAAQIVHVIRDARDVVASSLAAYRGRRFFYMDPYYAARTWRSAVGRGITVGRALPGESYHELRYEQLTADPERVLRELCDFLDEQYDPLMASPHLLAQRHHHSAGIHRAVREPVTTGNVGRWRRDLGAADQRLVQSVTADLLVELGYALEPVGRASTVEHSRAAALRTKFVALQGGRRVLETAGVPDPTRLLRRLPRRPPAEPAPRPTAPTAPA